MKVGMLWFDNDRNTTLESKVQRAAEYYRKKYGKSPTVCFIHPSMIPDNEEDKLQSVSRQQLRISGLVIHSNITILPNHFWIGVNGVSESAPA